MSKASIVFCLAILTCAISRGQNRPDHLVNANAGIKKIIVLTLPDYRLFLTAHAPLDCLLSSRGNGYFLASQNDIQALLQLGIAIKEPAGAPALAHATSPSGPGGRFHTWQETNQELATLASRFPTLAKVMQIGKTTEGRNLTLIKISSDVSQELNKPNIFICGCHHAREWISVEVALMFAAYMVENAAGNDEVRSLVNNCNLYILPIANPDGHEFSMFTYRLWRTNRHYLGSFYNGLYMWGVDINRNYGYEWGVDDQGSSPYPGDETYRGSAPFSELEAQVIRDFLLAHPPAAALSYHSYSQIIIYPWGYTTTPCPDAARFHALSAEMSQRMAAINGHVYDYGSSEILYPTNGEFCDWVYGTFNAPALTIELPPPGYPDGYYDQGGFFAREELIDPTFNENLPGLLYFIHAGLEWHGLDHPSKWRAPQSRSAVSVQK